ncbi:8a0bd361-dd55-4e7e-89be-f80cc03f473c [Sclerotinia trifoliorum]|uniref:8a0bd361-dd55-4e7e-89be-f80cc03f473c n=1 Tax=Sclerotinia trifoliorum TaxID=28548 RepID=A0A8H2VT52_9HELO|nr:8a0bd361-dd55-4e7e-89be-f80cc03f473c [Sclerotinia trifoliorum]
MPPKLLKRPISAKQQTKPQPKTKQKGKGKVLTVLEAPKTAQDLLLNQKQSLELVKIGVNAAISHFVFYRRFFPSNCYKTRIYNASDANPTYEIFMSGTNIPKNLNLMEAGDDILSFNTIVRGSGNQGAEKLLDWLEFGVSNAIDDKCLAKLQLSVYREEVVLEQLVEAFTINFTYKDIGNNTHVQISASTSNEAGQIINLGKAQEGLRELVRQVMNCSRDIKGKSSGRKVSMQLLYNDNPRPKNEYRGFRAASSSQILPDNCGLFIGEMNNGFNGLELKYYDAPAIDSHLKANSSRRAKETPGRNRFAMIRSPKPTTPEAIIDDSQSSSRHTQFSQSHGSQESTVRWINQIGRTRGSDDMDTQLLSNHASQSTTFGKHITFPEPKELDYMDIEEEEEEEGEAVRCECTNYDDRENLIQCEKCRNFCHSQCYGYSKGSVVANFECYECLLAESEQDILFEKMYPLCTRRRMVYYLKNNGFNDMEGLCQYMNLNYKETHALVEALKTEGIIKKCSDYSKEPFQFSNLKRLLGELFDPSKHISHTKLFVSAAASKVNLSQKSQDQVQAQLTPLARRLVPSDGPTRGGLRSEGSSTQTPSSWRSLHNETLRRSPRVPAQSTPQQSNKRAGDEISENAAKKRRAALDATSPFSVRSNSLH